MIKKNCINSAILFFLFFVLLLICIQPLRSYDLGYHLATGSLILETGKIPQQDPFSFTHPTGIWPLHQWLPAVIITTFYKLGSYLGLYFF